MGCPRCGKAVTPGAAFCMHCGQVLPAASVAGAAPVLAATNRRPLMVGLGTGVFLMLLLLVGLGATGILRIRGSLEPSNSLRKQDSLPAPVLQKEDKRDAPVEMPADIRDWLEHLRRTEIKKNELHARQVADLSVMATMMRTLGSGAGAVDHSGNVDTDNLSDPGKATKNKIEDLRPQWRSLIEFFNSKTPPEECKPIAHEYDQAIREVSAMQGDLLDIMNSIQDDPQSALTKLYQMQGKSGDAIDKHFGTTDDLVQDICDKYHVKKWFEIKKDLGIGGSLSSPGL